MNHEPVSRDNDEAATLDFFGNTLRPDFNDIADAPLRNGTGYLKYSNGAIYEGEWQNGERHGLGVCFYPSGNIFIGQFQHGLMEGTGTMFFSTGECFTGTFRRSMIHRGVYSSKGREIYGVWEDGRRTSETPSTAPADLQRARAALYSTIVEQVSQYLWHNVEDSTSYVIPSQVTTSLRPPLDIPFSTSDGSPLPHAPLKAAPVVHAEMMNSSFASNRYHSSYFVADGEVKEEPQVAQRDYGSPEMLFVCAVPMTNEVPSISRFFSRCFVFLFPLLSLPWLPVAPLSINSMQEEREFVVSGAVLRNDFKTPSLSLWIITIALLCQIASIVLVACKVTLGSVYSGHLTLPEIVVPCILWLAVGLVGAAYTCFFRYPHGLERIDRSITPKLSAFTASVVDAKASVCIYTYDEDGRGKVMNQHYRYRWLLFSVLYGAMMSLSAPATRGGFGHRMFGTGSFETSATALAFLATFFLSSVLTYYVLKMTDMQREIRAKLHVLTHLAFLEHRSLMKPSKSVSMAFHMDEPLRVQNLFSGFPGWYAMRSLILYASACANHSARRMAMGIFWFAMLSAYVVALGDIAVQVIRGGSYDYKQNYSTAYSYGIFVFVFWGLLLFRFFVICWLTQWELQRHLCIMDVASLYQRVTLKNVSGSEIIQRCRDIAAFGDARPELFHSTLYPLFVAVTALLNLAALGAVGYQLGAVIYF